MEIKLNNQDLHGLASGLQTTINETLENDYGWRLEHILKANSDRSEGDNAKAWLNANYDRTEGLLRACSSLLNALCITLAEAE